MSRVLDLQKCSSMFHSDEITSETCLIDGLEESFDLHFTRPSINHLSPDLKKNMECFFFFSQKILEKKKSHGHGENVPLEQGRPTGPVVTSSMSSVTRALSAWKREHLGPGALHAHLLFTAVLHLCIQKIKGHGLGEVHKLYDNIKAGGLNRSSSKDLYIVATTLITFGWRFGWSRRYPFASIAKI